MSRLPSDARAGVAGRHALVLVLLLSSTVAACRRQSSSAPTASAEVTVTPAAPVVNEPAHVVLRLSDGQHRAIGQARLQIEAHMLHPGMAPVIEPLRETDAAGYAADLSLTMAGDWVLFVSGTLAGGERVRLEAGRVTVRAAG